MSNSPTAARRDGRLRRFTGIAWIDDERTHERFSLLAASHADAVNLLRETYGEAATFTHTDEEAANRVR